VAHDENSETSDFLKDDACPLLTDQLSIVEARGLSSAQSFLILAWLDVHAFRFSLGRSYGLIF
jgi:hypothetical protein